MSRKWKIAIGVIVAAVVIAGVALAVWGVVTFRNRIYEHGWGLRAHKWGPEATAQLEVRLVDDDGDGIPDRGVVEVPTGLPFDRGFGLGHRLPFGPGHGPRFGRGFGPFFIMGGLFRLAFLALLVGLAVAFFRHWNRAKEAREPERG